MEELPLFLTELLKLVKKIIVTKGNHDGNIERLVPEGAEVVDEFIEDGIGYFHGHKKPSEKLLKQELIVCGHTHPAILLKDIRADIRQAWIETKVKDSNTRVLVVPAFDDSRKGVAMNNREPVGPFLKKMIDLENAEIYLLDGSYLGTISELRV
jgi:putative SbcD/Mre11-related phosphoesterase